MQTIKRILVSTDLGSSSDTVMRAAAALGELTGAELHVLHTYEFNAAPYGDVPAETFQARIAQIKQTLDQQIERTVPPKSRVASRDVIIYVAFKAILERADSIKADLIVLGRHRGGATAAGFLGGTADRVLREAKVPVLVVHDPLAAPLRRVLAPIDLSEPALHALEIATSWATSLAPAGEPAEIIALHVIPQVYHDDAVPFDSAQLGARMHEEVEARSQGQTFQSLRFREEIIWADDAAAAILAFIEKEKVDMTVMGTHGHGAIKRALIGSVASGVARAAGCPVLLVPPAHMD